MLRRLGGKRRPNKWPGGSHVTEHGVRLSRQERYTRVMVKSWIMWAFIVVALWIMSPRRW
jgi:hypothetical protein